MKQNILLLFVFTFPFLINAQHIHTGQCGTASTQADIQRLLESKAYIKEHGIVKSDLMTLIPLKLHLVARNNGTGRISELQAMEGICKLNEDFAPLNMRFFLYDDFNYIDNTALFDLQFPGVPLSVQILYQQQRVDNCVNIFIGNGLSSGNSGYYTGFYDLVYMDKSYVNDHDGILAHELGHYFSLIHTFYGWETTTYDPSMPTPTTVVYNGSNFNVEYVARTNCSTSGDFICDTPADYITSWGNCNYTGGAVDPIGTPIDPDETNHMAYYSFGGCEEYTFSEEQQEAILGSYLSRADLTIPETPDQTEVTAPLVLSDPIDGTFIPTFDEVTFTWEAVPGATKYIIQISPLSVFSLIDDTAIIEGTSYTSTVLRSDREQYYWRVLPYSEYSFCDLSYSETGIFATGDISTSVIDIAETVQANIFPNPAKANSFQLELVVDQRTEVEIQITDIRGKQVLPVQYKAATSGKNSWRIDANLTAGIYLVQLRSDWALKTLKLIKG